MVVRRSLAPALTFVDRIACAWASAAQFASQRAADLNRDRDSPDDFAHQLGARFRRVEQSRWIDAYERAERQAELVRETAIGDEDE